MLGRRIMLTLAAIVAAGAAVPPAVGLIDSHSARLAQAPFSHDGSAKAGPHVANAAIGRDWTAVSR